MENENLDLDVKPAGNKDLWLFLVIIDIVALCVFGFFIYKHFSVQLFQQPSPVAQEAVSSPAPVPASSVKEETPLQETVPAEEIPVVQLEEVSVAQVLAAEARAAEKAAAQKAADKSAEQASADKTEPAKESVLIEKNAKSKYRKVTFRWYGEGEKVAVVSGFTMSKPKALTKKQDYWEITLSIAPGTYKFLYVVDGKNRRDPYSPEQDGRSVVVIE